SHLERCAPCAAALQRLAEGDRRLAAARPTPPPLSPAASRTLLDRALAEAGVRRRSQWGGWLPLAWGFAAVFALIASGVGMTWWHPVRTTRDPLRGRLVAAAPRPVPGVSAPTTIDASNGPRSTETGPAAPRVSEPRRQHHPPTKQ